MANGIRENKTINGFHLQGEQQKRNQEKVGMSGWAK